MTQEDRNLLIRDICARIPYGVKGINCNGYISSPKDWETEFCILTAIKHSIAKYEWRPYLFPLSSMTEEQYKEFIMISGWDVDIEDVRRGKFSCIGYIGFDYLYDAEDWFNKNHFDWRGLIPKNLAIDCTNLNIY